MFFHFKFKKAIWVTCPYSRAWILSLKQQVRNRETMRSFTQVYICIYIPTVKPAIQDTWQSGHLYKLDIRLWSQILVHTWMTYWGNPGKPVIRTFLVESWKARTPLKSGHFWWSPRCPYCTCSTVQHVHEHILMQCCIQIFIQRGEKGVKWGNGEPRVDGDHCSQGFRKWKWWVKLCGWGGVGIRYAGEGPTSCPQNEALFMYIHTYMYICTSIVDKQSLDNYVG